MKKLKHREIPVLNSKWNTSVFGVTSPSLKFEAFARTLSFCAIGLLSSFSHAATIQVNSASDLSVNDSGCTLRSAIESFNSQAFIGSCMNFSEAPFRVGDTIVFSANLTGMKITLSGTKLEISSGNVLRIDASSVGGITLDGNAKSTVIRVSGAVLTVDNIAITNGFVAASDGGGIVTSGSIITFNNSSLTNNRSVSSLINGGGGRGGGIAAFGSSLIFNNVTVSGNSVDGPLDGFGGGILVSRGSSLTLNNTTLSSNTASGTRNGGGGVAAESSSSVMINNSTLSNNLSSSGRGHGLLALDNSTAVINHSTFQNSNLDAQGSSSRGDKVLSFLDSSSATISNSLVSTNFGLACSIPASQLILQGSNFSTDGSCGTQASNINLGLLANNGCAVLQTKTLGNTCVYTHALLEDSIAIDAAVNSTQVQDQRGVIRTQGAADTGAFEVWHSETDAFLVVPIKKGRSAVLNL